MKHRLSKASSPPTLQGGLGLPASPGLFGALFPTHQGLAPLLLTCPSHPDHSYLVSLVGRRPGSLSCQSFGCNFFLAEILISFSFF